VTPRAFLPSVLVIGLIMASGADLSAQQPAGTRSLRLELPGAGTILVRPVSRETDESASQLLFEKPGGSLTVLTTLDALDFVELLKGDLDGDHSPEVIAVARNRGSDDLLPFVYGGGSNLHQIFPPAGEDNALFGKEITISTASDGAALTLKVPITIHDFGPPDLYSLEFYRLKSDRLEKVEERLLGGSHFNQRLNKAGWAFSRGRYLEALQEYSALMASPPADMPLEARSEALFAEAESRKFLKDFATARSLYDQVGSRYPGTPMAHEAARESAFLKENQGVEAGLSLYMDVSQLNRSNRTEEALQLLELRMPGIATGSIAPHLHLLKGELLSALGKAEEAIKLYRTFAARFPRSPLQEQVDSALQELEGNPDEGDGSE